MRELFDLLRRDGETVLDRLIAERRQEAVDLEFKRKEDASTGASVKDQRKLGRQLSAFSNSMGGLIVWGVKANKDPASGVDCASKAVPIPNIDKFKNDVIRLSGQILMPKNDGIIVESIPSVREPGAGYLALYVERSERRPHRSEVSGDRQYYKRAGDSTFAMEHYDIEDSFRRREVASVDVEWQIRDGGSMSSGGKKTWYLDVVLSLVNSSLVTAIFPYLVVEGWGAGEFQAHITPGFPHRKQGSAMHFEATGDQVIHPGQSREIAVWRLSVGSSMLGMQPIPNLEGVQPFTISCRCGCQDSRIKTKHVTIPREAMAQALPGEVQM